MPFKPFNHAHEIIALEFGARLYLAMLLTCCVPYLVSTDSSAMTEMQNTRTDPALGMPSEGQKR